MKALRDESMVKKLRLYDRGLVPIVTSGIVTAGHQNFAAERNLSATEINSDSVRSVSADPRSTSSQPNTQLDAQLEGNHRRAM
jgi:hypothetical protein